MNIKPIGELKPAGIADQKIDEYVSRIKNGESKDSIFRDLPPSFIKGIEEKLNAPIAEKEDKWKYEIPLQYKGLDSETLDFIWTIPEYMDPEKTKELKAIKAKIIETLRAKESAEAKKDEKHHNDDVRIEELKEKLGIPAIHQETEIPKVDKNENPTLGIDERKKLQGWPASYELAKIAKSQGIDLSKISREEYVDFAIKNSLAIDDDQLRVAPWQRTATSVQEIVLKNREMKAKINPESEKAFAKFCFETQEKARTENRQFSENVRVRQGTKDSNSWLYFGINKGSDSSTNETYKSYFSVKDLNTLTPERFTEFMNQLRDSGYNGDIKIFQDLSEQGVRLNDQVVMHGASQADAILGLQAAEKFFGSDLEHKSIGKDEIIDGKSKSYSQILAKKIQDVIQNKI
jgi:hypothetical protein